MDIRKLQIGLGVAFVLAGAAVGTGSFGTGDDASGSSVPPAFEVTDTETRVEEQDLTGYQLVYPHR